jgi:hypothetical protein
MLAVLDETEGSTYLSRVPTPCQRRLLRPAGARLAKWRGYEVWLTR